MTSVPVRVPETNWNLVINGVRLATGTSSPRARSALAAGLLLTDGFVRKPADLLELGHHEDEIGTTLDACVTDAAFALGMAERRHREERGCALMHFVSCEPTALHRDRPAGYPAMDRLADRLRDLFDASARDSPGGGVHAAALASADEPMHVMVDVSRHAAVHKTTGSGFIAGIDASTVGLVLTARVSGLIALTAARAGVAWIASRSVATTLALEIARCAGLPIITRVGSRDPAVLLPAGRPLP